MSNSNIAIQSVGTVAWDGAEAFPADIRKFGHFAWSFEVTEDLTADAVFAVEAAPADEADNCIPGAFEPVEAVATCQGANGGEMATITIPEGTLAGSICSGTIPCRSGAFVQLVAEEGDTAKIKAVIIRGAPKI